MVNSDFIKKGKKVGGKTPKHQTRENAFSLRVFSSVYFSHLDKICLEKFCVTSKPQMFSSSP